jgi:4-amino-4-deoxy-L-arabinose transferase-like glycosyltransferase
MAVPRRVVLSLVKSRTVLLLVILVLGGLLRGLRLSWVPDIFDDEVTYDYFGYHFARFGFIRDFKGIPPFFHPPLFGVLLGPVVKILGVQSLTPEAVLHLRLFSLPFSIFVMVLVFTVVRRVGGPFGGAVAAVLVATDPFLIRYGRMNLLEWPALTFTLASLSVFLLRTGSPGRTFPLVEGVALGLALSTKEISAYVCVSYLVTGLLLPRLRTRAFLAVILAFVVYGVFAVVSVSLSLPWSTARDLWTNALNGDSWRSYLQFKWWAILRIVGIHVETGYLTRGAPSLMDDIVYVGRYYAWSFFWLAVAAAYSGWLLARWQTLVDAERLVLIWFVTVLGFFRAHPAAGTPALRLPPCRRGNHGRACLRAGVCCSG